VPGAIDQLYQLILMLADKTHVLTALSVSVTDAISSEGTVTSRVLNRMRICNNVAVGFDVTK